MVGMAGKVQRSCGVAAEFRGERKILEGWRRSGYAEITEITEFL
jgi:hypothetical protein